MCSLEYIYWLILERSNESACRVASAEAVGEPEKPKYRPVPESATRPRRIAVGQPVAARA
jgi:hypothetical protein